MGGVRHLLVEGIPPTRWSVASYAGAMKLEPICFLVVLNRLPPHCLLCRNPRIKVFFVDVGCSSSLLYFLLSSSTLCSPVLLFAFLCLPVFFCMLGLLCAFLCPENELK